MKLNRKIDLGLFTLLLGIGLFYGIFTPFRLVRLAGDEKVYVATAVEMLERGEWFKQYLFGQPEMFKGLFHHWEILVGTHLFGYHLFSALWMNLFWVLFGVGSFYRSIKIDSKSLEQNQMAWGVSGLLAFSVAAFSHLYVSQMEATLFGMMAFVTATAYRYAQHLDIKNEFLLWVGAGLLSWPKSPVYSVLVGLSVFGMIVQLSLKEGWKRALIKGIRFSPIGVVVGLLPYLPSIFLDWDNFYQHYLLREQFSKRANHQPISFIWMPFLMYLLPVSLFLGYQLIQKTWGFLIGFLEKKKREASSLSSGFKIAVWLCTPWATFFTLNSYKGQNYLLPMVPCFYLVFYELLIKHGWKPFHGVFKLLSAMGLLVGVIVLYLFSFLFGWEEYLWVLFALVVFIKLWVLGYALLPMNRRSMAFGAAGMVGVFATLFAMIGEYESISMREVIRQNTSRTLVYVNLSKDIFNEWALQRYALSYSPIKTIQKVEDVAQYAQDAIFIFKYEADKNKFLSEVQTIRPTLGVFVPGPPIRKFKTKAHKDLNWLEVLQDPEKYLKIGVFMGEWPTLFLTRE